MTAPENIEPVFPHPVPRDEPPLGTVLNHRATRSKIELPTTMPTVVHVHHDTEAHIRSFNEGYEAAVTQGLADDPTLADDWFQEKLRAAKAEALEQAAADLYADRGDVRSSDVTVNHGINRAVGWLQARAEAVRGEATPRQAGVADHPPRHHRLAAREAGSAMPADYADGPVRMPLDKIVHIVKEAETTTVQQERTAG